MLSKVEFPTKVIKYGGFKILTPKQMYQRLPIALAQLKAGNTSKYLLNEIRQISRLRKINRKYQLQVGMKDYLMDHTLYQICKVVWNIYQKTRRKNC